MHWTSDIDSCPSDEDKVPVRMAGHPGVGETTITPTPPGRSPDGRSGRAVVFPGAWLVADSGGMAGGDDGAGPDAGPGRRWDVALSFAGAQRDYVGQVAAALKARGVRCFYDEDEQVRLWGTHLAEELPRIYSEESAAPAGAA